MNVYLDRKQRAASRRRAVQAAMLLLHNAQAVHYTQGPDRWQGINQKLDESRGQFPNYGDCSSSATWCLWNGIYLPWVGVGDVVNGDRWNAGYTGTMARHGREVHHVRNVIRGDCVLYGPAPTYEHVAIVVGHRKGVPIVVSHGSEAGPFLLPYNYRDVGQIRRYILREGS
jgi:hypothetical protein